MSITLPAPTIHPRSPPVLPAAPPAAPPLLPRCPLRDIAMVLEDELSTAAANGRTADVDDLLRAGADVNGLNRFGRRALQVGVRHQGRQSSVWRLNASRVDIKGRQNYGRNEVMVIYDIHIYDVLLLIWWKSNAREPDAQPRGSGACMGQLRHFLHFQKTHFEAKLNIRARFMEPLDFLHE